ncbi:FAD-dependent monooxygenase [Kitasatospora sp. NPDC058115]|uniref:FAD-dependent monooxygenase n=1 Tax=Kitasatospora sp. NPDC058115 TaxID=3346347 RepID=UPI0036D9C1E0
MTRTPPEGRPRRVACIGAGPAGLLAATQIKAARPGWSVDVYERAPEGETYGYGVVFSDTAVRTIDFIAPSLGRLLAAQVTWDAVEVRARGRRHRSAGHGYVALSRHRLLAELAGRAAGAGVALHYGVAADAELLSAEYDVVVAADGAASRTRRALAGELGARTGLGRSRFAWLGTAAEFDAMTFIFEETAHGPVVAHGYPHGDGVSTFVVELPATGDPAAAAERGRLEQDLGHWSDVFAEHLAGHPLQAKDLRWANFPAVRLDRCVRGNVVVIGDASHTVHYSVGSGTRMALEDGYYLARALHRHEVVADALAEYERRRLPSVRALQDAGERSMRWFENAPAHLERPGAQFSVHLLSRAVLPVAARVRAEAPDLVDEATRVVAGGDYRPAPDGALALPLDVGGLRLPGRLVLDLGDGTPEGAVPQDAPYGCVLAPPGRPAGGAIVTADRLADHLAGPASRHSAAPPPLVVVDMGVCPPDPARAGGEAAALSAAVADRGGGRAPGAVVAVRSTVAATGGPASGGAVEALLARLRAMRSAGLCELADLDAGPGGGAAPEAVLDALEWADAVRSALGIPVMLSGFRARPDQAEPHILAGRIDAWCVRGAARTEGGA